LLPCGNDHKYIYSHTAYDLKATDLQAVIGLLQLQKLPHFIEIRRRNFQLLYDGLRRWEEFLILPQATPDASPSWFGFLISVRKRAAAVDSTFGGAQDCDPSPVRQQFTAAAGVFKHAAPPDRRAAAGRSGDEQHILDWCGSGLYT